MEHPPFVERADPASVFSLLADERRITILRTLWDSDEGLSFTELRDAVGIRDSGQFNYHLEQLLDHLVSKRDDGSYALTEAGRQINGAIQAGTYTASGEGESIDLERSCPGCGGTRTFTYESERVTVQCEPCEITSSFPVPPSAFAGCAREEMPEVAERYLRVLFGRIDAGFCVYCDGPTAARARPVTESTAWSETDGSESEPIDPRTVPIIEYDCHQCGAEPTSSLPMALVDHPAVVSFYFDHGIDIRDRPVWDFMSVADDNPTIRSHDPFRASHTFSVDEHELTVVVDEEVTVVETETARPGG